MDLYKSTKKAYGIRSKIVHGSCIAEKEREAVKNLSTFCDNSLRKVLRKIMCDEKIKSIFDGKDLDIDNYMLKLIFDIK